jgi:hypothetical protein
LLKGLLVIEPEKRLTLEQVSKGHSPFI